MAVLPPSPGIPIHPNRPGSFLCVILPSFPWADPTDLSVLHLPLKAGCCIPPLATQLAKGRLGAQEGVRARAQRDRGAALSCSVPAAAARPLWWHVSGPAPCSSEGAAGQAHCYGTSGAWQLLSLNKHVRNPSSLRQEGPLTQGMFSWGVYICKGNAKPLLQHIAVARGGSSERLQGRLLMFTMSWAVYILF